VRQQHRAPAEHLLDEIAVRHVAHAPRAASIGLISRAVSATT
jgi:hypothetical protein